MSPAVGLIGTKGFLITEPARLAGRRGVVRVARRFLPALFLKKGAGGANAARPGLKLARWSG